MNRRVVVTGFGMVSSLAPGRETTWAAMLEGRDGLGPLTRLNLPLEPAQIAGQVPLAALRHQTLCERMALLALEEALDGFTPPGDPGRIGVFQGAGTSGLPVAEAYLEERLAGGRGRALEPAYQTPCNVADALARRLGACGPRATLMNACSSSLLALGQAWERIVAGELDVAVAGGAESLCRTTYGGFSCLKAVDPRKCRPFSRDRAGLNLGEGAARALAMALRQGRLDADQVDLVSAHGTATPANDGAECLAIRRALGPAADAVSVTSTKSQFGHTLGAAGAFGAAAAILALRDQVVSPTLRLDDPDPLCDLDCTPLVAKQRRLRAALVNAFAFGGNNVSLLLGRWSGA